jgi:hypothetical protein
MSAHTAVETLLGRIRDWWHMNHELGTVDRHELDHIAQDLGMTGSELRDLAARGPDAAHLLYERMRALGISKEDVERAALGLMRDLERTCACCNDKGVCEQDLAKRPGDPKWQRYCPNAISLQSLTQLKDRFPA